MSCHVMVTGLRKIRWLAFKYGKVSHAPESLPGIMARFPAFWIAGLKPKIRKPSNLRLK